MTMRMMMMIMMRRMMMTNCHDDDGDNDDDGYCGGGDDNDVTLFESNLLPASSTKTLTGLFISFEEARILWAALSPAIPPPTTITSYFFLSLFDSII